MKAALSRTCSARCRRDWNRRRRSFHLLQPSLLIVSQVTAACECGWGAWTTSSASGAMRSRPGCSELFGEEGIKKKKNLAAGVSVSHVFQCEICFVALKCEMFGGDCGYRSAEKWARSRRGPSSADEASRREELRSARVFMTNKWEYQRDGHLGVGRFLERWLCALIGLQL